jgi:hypothetical protein
MDCYGLLWIVSDDAMHLVVPNLEGVGVGYRHRSMLCAGRSDDADDANDNALP